MICFLDFQKVGKHNSSTLKLRSRLESALRDDVIQWHDKGQIWAGLLKLEDLNAKSRTSDGRNDTKPVSSG